MTVTFTGTVAVKLPATTWISIVYMPTGVVCWSGAPAQADMPLSTIVETRAAAHKSRG